MSQRKANQSLDALSQVNLDAAGIDLGSESHWVCVPSDRDSESVREFGTCTAELRMLADWLAACGVKTVAMESTGVYWIPLYELLEARGFDVNLVNARDVKNVSGRKTDIADCQWLWQLHTYGLLKSSFRPAAEICQLRALVRHRDMLVRYRAIHVQHMQKALLQMNRLLTTVVSDITGVSGMKIMRAIVAGERNIHHLASYRDPRCHKDESAFALALEGTYQPEYLYMLKDALDLYDYYGAKLQACDAELEALYTPYAPPTPDQEGQVPTAPAPKGRPRRKNQAHFDLADACYRLAGVDLTRIDGIQALTAQEILSEIGPDVSAWPTVKHFTSWLGLSPNHQITGGRIMRRQTKPVVNRAASALRMAAQSLARSQSALGAFYRRLRARLGPQKALTATAHKLARIIYFMLKRKDDYVDPGETAYTEQMQQRRLRKLERQAATLGFSLQPLAA